MMNSRIFTLTAILFFSVGCSKDYLEKKPDTSMLVPTTPDDYQQLLDNYSYSYSNTTPGLSEVSSDNFYADKTTVWYDQAEENAYFWKEDIYNNNPSREWTRPYTAIFYMNVILEGLESADSKDTQRKNELKGAAFFFRGFAYYNLAQLFTAPYNAQTAANELGVPLRLSSDVKVLLPRGKQDELYNQILSDLKSATDLLPEHSEYANRPNKAAALGMLARVCLAIQRYEDAFSYSAQALEIKAALTDYNTLPVTPGINPFPVSLPNGNDEILIHMQPDPYVFIDQQLAYVDSSLIKSYSDNDLRKKLFFSTDNSNRSIFTGNYAGYFGALFSGIATDELYLIKAESAARLDKPELAAELINELLVRRYDNTFTPFSFDDVNDLLRFILDERRKELIGRGLRWEDLRRLNQDPAFAKTLERINNQNESTKLLPNSNRYTFPIPADEISRSGIEQNPR